MRWFGVVVVCVGLLVSSVAVSQQPGAAESAEKVAEVKNGLAATIELGEAIVENTRTHPLSKPYVGNALNCTSCHLDNGRHEEAASFIGIATAYPAWSPREKRVITLQDRVLNCFMRSENGVRPPIGGKVATAVTTYITSLSEGQPIKMNHQRPLGPNAVVMLDPGQHRPNVDHGRVLYADHCASCHGEDGQGLVDGPPVWGPDSYNDGAGLSRVPKLASWLKVAMPLDDPFLSEEEAFDIAAFVNSHQRPKFKLSEHLPAEEKLGEYNAESSETISGEPGS
ncbi:c-type cytochrome [Roseimaritima sediminicola]|uniref:c-type cytochrome n=1 Tax=Roseimaritima sediminicola TaxID=2662066 RepID=UPI00129837A5|nr:c-type cytochrome [Roseimaritima sediminicola]